MTPNYDLQTESDKQVKRLRRTMRGVTIASVEALLEETLKDAREMMHFDHPDDLRIVGTIEAALELLAQIDAHA